MEQDQQVTIARNQQYWAEAPKLPAVRFIVVPDATTRALELRKGSADIAINSLTADTVFALRSDPALATMTAPGTIYSYLAMNLRDPILRDVRVRQALAYAIDRQPIIHYLLRDLARPAASVLPPQSWAFDGDVAQYPHDPRRARELLDQAGYKVGKDGYRFHLNMKTSTEESTYLLTAVLQQQLREVGIALDIRSFQSRFSADITGFADITRGAFQLFFSALDRRQRGPRHFRARLSLDQYSSKAGESRLLLESGGRPPDRRCPRLGRPEAAQGRL